MAPSAAATKMLDGSSSAKAMAPVTHLNFILYGEIHVRRHHTGPMMLFIARTGQMTGKLPFSRMKGYGGDGYTIGPVWVLDIHESLFPAMLTAIPSMAQRCVSVLLDRVREVTRMEQQAEKLAALGKLAANLAHELNNPASAAQRSAAALFAELRQYGPEVLPPRRAQLRIHPHLHPLQGLDHSHARPHVRLLPPSCLRGQSTRPERPRRHDAALAAGSQRP